MIRMTRILALALLAVLCTACGTTPRTDYYLLDALAAQPETPRGEGPSVGLSDLRVAEYLQRPEVLVLETANRLQLREYSRWVEPLPDGIERTLLLNLAALLDSDRVRARPWPRSWSPEWQLRVEVVRLDAREGTAELVANWSLVHGAKAHEHSARITRARSGSGAESVAADFSALVLELAERIAVAIAAAPRATEAGA